MGRFRIAWVALLLLLLPGVAGAASLYEQQREVERAIVRLRAEQSHMDRLRQRVNDGLAYLIYTDWNRRWEGIGNDEFEKVNTLAFLFKELESENPNWDTYKERLAQQLKRGAAEFLGRTRDQRGKLEQDRTAISKKLAIALKQRDLIAARIKQAEDTGEGKGQANFTGKWLMIVNLAYRMEYDLKQDGDQVTGSLKHAGGTATLSGTVKGNVLTYLDNYGTKGEMILVSNDSIRGSYTLKDGQVFPFRRADRIKP